jgi:hypothetical protein
MAATARQRSASRDRRPILARAGRKTDESRPGRLRRHPARAVGGRGRTSTRRPPRRSALVAHPRSATANAEQRPRHGQRCPSDETENHAGTRPAATQAALGPAARIRSEPLKTSLSQHRRCIGRGLLPRPPTRIKHQGPRLLLGCGPLRGVPDRPSLHRASSGADLAGQTSVGFHRACTMPRGLKWNPTSTTTSWSLHDRRCALEIRRRIRLHLCGTEG